LRVHYLLRVYVGIPFFKTKENDFLVSIHLPVLLNPEPEPISVESGRQYTHLKALPTNFRWLLKEVNMVQKAETVDWLQSLKDSFSRWFVMAATCEEGYLLHSKAACLK
jgi:hypothetical protein